MNLSPTSPESNWLLNNKKKLNRARGMAASMQRRLIDSYLERHGWVRDDSDKALNESYDLRFGHCADKWMWDTVYGKELFYTPKGFLQNKQGFLVWKRKT